MVLVVAVLIASFVAEVQAARSASLNVRVYDSKSAKAKGASVTVYDNIGNKTLRSKTTNKKGEASFKLKGYTKCMFINVTVTYGTSRFTKLYHLNAWKTLVEINMPPE